MDELAFSAFTGFVAKSQLAEMTVSVTISARNPNSPARAIHCCTLICASPSV